VITPASDHLRRIFQSKGGTKVAAPLKKRTIGLPTGTFFRREAKNPAQADCKPLARYGAMGRARSQLAPFAGKIGRGLTTRAPALTRTPLSSTDTIVSRVRRHVHARYLLSVITITGIRDHHLLERLITIPGIRTPAAHLTARRGFFFFDQKMCLNP
jgi:hypothetical protein